MTAETFTHIFFTELLGMPVYDLKHRRIGRVRDAALVPLVHPSRIDRFLVGAGGSWLTVRYDQIASISLEAASSCRTSGLTRITRTNTCCVCSATCSTSRSSTSTAARWSASTTSPSKSVATTAIRSRVMEIDVGVRSIFRRVVQGVLPPQWIRRRMQRPIPPNSIRWEFCNIVEADPQRRLRLNISHDRLELLHPADLADIVEELGPAEREAIFGTLDSEVAAEALSEIDPKMQASILESLEPEEGRRHRRGDVARRGRRRPRRTRRGDQ